MVIHDYETSVFSDIGFAKIHLQYIHLLVSKHSNEIRKHDSTCLDKSDTHIVTNSFKFNSHVVLLYYNNYIARMRYTQRDTIAELLYTAEHSVSVNDDYDRAEKS